MLLQGEELLRDLLAVQVIIELNVAFCERHLVNCPPSEQLQKECAYVSCNLFLGIACSCQNVNALESICQSCQQFSAHSASVYLRLQDSVQFFLHVWSEKTSSTLHLVLAAGTCNSTCLPACAFSHSTLP